MKDFLCVALVTIFCTAIIPVSQGATPKIVKYNSQTDFEKGDPKGVSINFFGHVVLAPRIQATLQPDLTFVWAAVADRDGNVYAAGGNGGKVFQIRGDNSSDLIFEAPEIQIYALAADRNNNVYVAGSPNGKVYKLAGGQKKSPERAVFFDATETYIWSMAVDSEDNLYVATGEKGNIYKVDKDGNGTLFYAGEDEHIRKIIFDNKGNLIAGTSNDGVILKIRPSGEAFVLYDSPLAEISDLMIDKKGQLFAVANGESRALNRPNVSASQSGDSGGDEQDESQADNMSAQQLVLAGATAQEKQHSSLYQIDSDRTVTTIWENKREQMYAVAPGTAAGELILATGSNGRVYSITPDGEYTLLTKLEEIDVTTLFRKKDGGLYLGTSNTGKVYQLERKLSEQGEFISDIIDASVISQWGALNWEADIPAATRLEFFTRSGNTEKPNKTWSSWSGPYTSDRGSNIQNPAARFLQVKAVLHSDDGSHSPVLKSFSVSYLQKNIAARLKAISILPPGEYYSEATGQSASNSHLDSDDSNSQNQSFGRKSYRKGYRTVSWYAEDPNDDALSYTVYYRGEDENTWKTLAEDLRLTAYSWDSELLPDGRFILKIVASDKNSNPPSQVLTSQKTSQPFVVDNSGPKVSAIDVKSEGGNVSLSFTVEDEWNIIDSVEYGLNANDWIIVYPVDGIADSQKEKFVINLPSGLSGSNTIVIKAKDATKNIGFGKSNFTVKK